MSQEFVSEYPPADLYLHFTHRRERAELFDFCKTTAEYIEQQGVGAVVFIDRAARPMRAGISEYWEKTHSKEEPMPDVFFVNPDGFAEPDIKSRMEVEHPFLLEHKDDTVLLIDTCIHKGGTLRPVLEGLEVSGFTDVQIGIAGNTRNRSTLEPDLIMHEAVPFGLCYPFGSDGLVKKGGTGLLSRASDNPALLAKGAMARKEIKRIINEYLENPPTSEDFDSPYMVTSGELAAYDLLEKWRKGFEAQRLRERKATLIGAELGIIAGQAANIVLSADAPRSIAGLVLGGIIGGVVGKSVGRRR